MNLKRYYNLGKNVLYPINRSITGKGVRQTLRIIKNEFPELKIKKLNLVVKLLIGQSHQNGMLSKHLLKINMAKR